MYVQLFSTLFLINRLRTKFNLNNCLGHIIQFLRRNIFISKPFFGNSVLVVIWSLTHVLLEDCVVSKTNGVIICLPIHLSTFPGIYSSICQFSMSPIYVNHLSPIPCCQLLLWLYYTQTISNSTITIKENCGNSIIIMNSWDITFKTTFDWDISKLCYSTRFLNSLCLPYGFFISA